MKLKQFVFAVIAAAFSTIFMSAAVHAQVTRAWVSGTGNDANPCSRTQPCRTFAGAIANAATGGEVSVLDAGDFGAVTITKSISIVADGAEGGIAAAGANAIIINAGANDVIHIHGLFLEGSGSGLNGIKILSAKNVYVDETTIRGFSTTITGDGCGISIASPTNPVRVYLRDVQVNNNRIGACVTGTGAAQNSLFVDTSAFEANSANSLVLTGAKAGAGAFGSVFAPTGMILSGGATFASTGNNRIAGAVGPTSTLPLQ